MCLIISKPAEAKLNYQHIENASGHNKDGFGIVVEGKTLYRTNDYNKFIDLLKTVEDKALLIHMRAASAGEVSDRNIQPFYIGDGYFCHNGTIFGLAGDNEHSDSKILSRALRELPDCHGRNLMLELALGNDRAAIVNKKGEVTMFGKWQEVEGMYYSSDYWREYETSGDDWDLFTVAVYGTLKKGHGNHRLLEGSKYLGKGVTVEKYPMTGTGMGFPYVYEEPGEGKRISVELYRVTAEVMDLLDDLEGVDHGHYYSNYVEVLKADNSTVMAEMYFAGHIRDPQEELLAEW